MAGWLVSGAELRSDGLLYAESFETIFPADFEQYHTCLGVETSYAPAIGGYDINTTRRFYALLGAYCVDVGWCHAGRL